MLHIDGVVQTRVLRLDISWNRHQQCFTCRELRCPRGHAEICSSCRTNCPCGPCRRFLDFGRITRGIHLDVNVPPCSLHVSQARYFKTMLKSADHWDKIKRLRVSDDALASLLPHYEVYVAQFWQMASTDIVIFRLLWEVWRRHIPSHSLQDWQLKSRL